MPGTGVRAGARHRASARRFDATRVVAVFALCTAVAGGASLIVLKTSAPAGTERIATAVTDPATPPILPRSTGPGPRPTSSLTPREPTRRASLAAPAPQEERPSIPPTGPGEFDIAGGRSPDGPSTLTYTVEIERGLPFDPRPTAALVDATLGDDRGWVTTRGTTFRRVTTDADLRVLIATPGTTDRLCAPLVTGGRVSCRNGDLVVLNARRWAFGVPHYRRFLIDYRRYVVNHEVGHALGESHVSCPGPRQPAPVMLQQTYGLEGCRRNPWPEVA